MDLPPEAIETVIQIVQRQLAALSLPALSENELNVEVDESFENDSQSGAKLTPVCVTLKDGPNDYNRSFMIKRWQPEGWVSLLWGVDSPLEAMLFESGLVDLICSRGGLYVPTIGSVSTEDGRWIIMDDVSQQLSAWRKYSISDGPRRLTSTLIVELHGELFDSMARYYVWSEDRNIRKRFRKIEHHLVPQERYLRRFEQIFREWLGYDTAGEIESQATRKAKERINSGRERHLKFLENLPQSERRMWIRHSTCRDTLVAAVSDLPLFPLHGDITGGNVGIAHNAVCGLPSACELVKVGNVDSKVIENIEPSIERAHCALFDIERWARKT